MLTLIRHIKCLSLLFFFFAVHLGQLHSQVDFSKKLIRDALVDFYDAVDLDGDGDVDLIVSLGWWENDGNESFTPRSVRGTSSKYGDMDGDGNLDIISIFSNSFEWYKNGDIDQVFEIENTTASGAYTIIDMDFDGDQDIFQRRFTAQGTNIEYYRNDGNNQFTYVLIETLTNTRINAVIPFDMDNDGDMDIIKSVNDEFFEFGIFNYGLFVSINDGQFNFTDRLVASNDGQSESFQNVFVADYDKDGDGDIFTGHFSGSTPFTLWENNGSNNFSQRVISNGPMRQMEIGDLNGDGKTDLVTSSNTFSIWYANPEDPFFTEDVLEQGPAPSITVIDLDSDGDEDIVSGNFWWENLTPITNDCPPPGMPINIETQAQFNSFIAEYPNCTRIQGDLTILNSPDITSLAGLENITQVDGNLLIVGNEELLSLVGLNNVSVVGGDVFVGANPKLGTVDLFSLSSANELTISDNPNLTGLAGWEQTLTLNKLTLTNNTSLSFCDVPAICEYLLGGLSEISNNSDGCNSIIEVEMECLNTGACPPTVSLVIQSQAELDAFAATYPNCSSIEGSIIIQGSTDIMNLQGLEGITDVGVNLVVKNNSSLTSLTGLQNISNIGGNLDVTNNPILPDFGGGFAALRTVGGDLQVTLNPELTNLGSLTGVQTVGQAVNIWDNEKLASIGLFSLQSADGLVIQNNMALNDLSGLDHSITINRLFLNDNTDLSSCDVQAICDWLGTDGFVSISDNGLDCNSTTEVEERCDDVALPDCVGSVFPGDGEQNIGINLTLQWAAVTGATEYEVEVGTSTGASNVISTTVANGGTSLTLPVLNYSTTYFVNITPFNGINYAVLCTEKSFTTEAQPLQDQTISFAPIGNKLTTDMPFEIVATASSELPVSFSILSGPATISNNLPIGQAGTITLTGEAGIVVVRASQAGNDLFNPASDVDQSFEVAEPNIGGPMPDGYCASSASSPWQEQIIRFQMGEIDNSSEKEGYADFTNQNTTVSPGGTYAFSITPNFSWEYYAEYYRIWIDYNRDGDFEDDGEEAYSHFESAGANGTVGLPVNGEITIPISSAMGTTRMRVAMKQAGFPEPCESFSEGEVEDYAIVIGEPLSGLTVTCPEDINVMADIASVGAIVSWNVPSTSTFCDVGFVTTTQITEIPSGSEFEVGEHIISYEVTDECGNSASCSFTITVSAFELVSTLNCPDDITVTVGEGETGALINFDLPSLDSNCPDATVEVDQTSGLPSGSIFPLGLSSNEFDLTLSCGLEEINASCSFTVTVEQNVIDCPEEIEGFTVLGEFNGHQYFYSNDIMNWMQAQAIAASYGGYLASINTGDEHEFLMANIPNYTLIGLNDVDSEGSFAWDSGDPLNYAQAVISNDAANDFGTINPWTDEWELVNQWVEKPFLMELPCSNIGPMISFECSDDINIIAESGASSVLVEWDEPTATTTCSNNIVRVMQTAGSPNGSAIAVGTTETVTYTFTDNCGNEEECSFEIAVSEFTNVFDVVCPPDIDFEVAAGTAGLAVNWEPPFVTTNCPDGSSIEQTSGLTSGSFFPVGASTVSYTITTACGEETNCSFDVIVNEKIIECVEEIEGFTALGEFEGHQYFLSNNNLNWDDAQSLAVSFDAYLVSINSAAENEFIRSNISAITFIGLTDAAVEGQPEWASGELVDFENVDTPPATDLDDFGAINFWNGGWSFYNEFVEKQFIIELPCNEEPTPFRKAFDESHKEVNNAITIQNLFPNPAHEYIFLKVNSEQAVETDLQVYDTFGRLVQEQRVSLLKGNNSIEVRLEGVNSGIYFIQLPGIDGIGSYLKFVKGK